MSVLPEGMIFASLLRNPQLIFLALCSANGPGF